MTWRATVKVNLGDLGKFEKKLAKEMPRLIREGQEIAAVHTRELMMEATFEVPRASDGRGAHDAAIWRGHLLHGWVVDHEGLMVIVRNTEKYMPWVQRGYLTTFGFPNYARTDADSLQQWVRDKFGVKAGWESKAAAFLVARAIKKRGLKPRPFGNFGTIGSIQAHYKKVIRARIEIAYRLAGGRL